MEDKKYTVECPHPDCTKGIKFGDNVPTGEYDCLCHGCRFTVSWSTFLGGERKPFLALVEKKK